MGKERCKLSAKEYKKKLAAEPKYTCSKCKRLAKKKDQVCKPEKIQ